MENLGKKLFDNKFLEKWNRHYYKLEAYFEQKKDNKLPLMNEVDEELINWLGIQNKIKNKLPAELRNKLSALNFSYNEQKDIWECMYQQLAFFAKENGHINLPDVANYEALKDWFLRQIQNKSYLSKSQINKLERLGIDWNIIITREQQWNQMFLKLQEFYLTYGHCQVPQRWKQDISLANWVMRQRGQWAAGKMLPDRESRLNSLNFIWCIQVIYDAQWQHHYQQLKAFYQEHGHLQVPGSYKQLTSWIENQRTMKKKKLLLADRERQLIEIGFSYSNIKINNWNERFKQLKAFQKKHGHSFVPLNYKENKALGIWVASQRWLESKSQLEEWKKRKLNQLNFIWHSGTQKQVKLHYDAQWNLTFERLKIYQQVYGTCQVSLKINPQLQRWTKWQRGLFYAGKLSPERMARLNEIRFPWNIQESYWMKMYEALSEFRNQYGHTQVPHQWAPNLQLAAWVYRMKATKSELSAQKVELLNLIGFDWHVNRKTVVAWEGMYERLLKFKLEFGHTRVPVKWAPDPKLGKWVSRMRQEKDKLLPERVALLNKIDFDWRKSFTLSQVNLFG